MAVNPLTGFTDPQAYNTGGDASVNTASTTQMNEFKWIKKALIELKDEIHFGPLADVTVMPKHYGKKIKRYWYLPMLDERNVNDQGIDATGAEIANGNLYGSSRDIGDVTSKMPTVGEHGGRVNRVGFSRKEIEGTFAKFGFFEEYTRDSVDYDSDAELRMHINREAIRAAQKMNEDALAADLVLNAGITKYPGMDTTPSEVETGDVVTYDDLVRLGMELTKNKTPKQTKVLTGTRMVDTRTVQGGYIAYVGPELLPLLMNMTDYHDNPAWKPAHEYAAGTTLLNGEEGAIGPFRFVVVQEMLKHEGKGGESAEGAKDGNDVLPILVVGAGSFTTIGFQTDGKSAKFSIINRKPSEETADRNDPFGETGFWSIKWHYGFMPLRNDRLAVFWTAEA